MDSWATLILGLALCLEQRIWAHYGSLAKPSIWAVPGSVISVGSSVTIFCRIPQGVVKVRLYCAEPTPELYTPTIQGAQDLAEFSFLHVTHVNAGSYYCEYWDERHIFERSDKLRLVVTGIYKQNPSLIVQSDPEVGSRGIVTLICQIPDFYSFVLCRDRGPSFPQNCSHQNHNTFFIFPGSLVERTIYTCYGSPDEKSYLWSLPSDPLELPVTGPPGHTAVWVSIAAVCFLLLLLLLLFLCLCRLRAKRRATDGETSSQVKHNSSSPAMNIEEELTCDDFETIQFKEQRQIDTQAPAAEDPQEVTYAQLHQETLMKSVGSLPSSAFQDASTQSCVYATLTVSQEESQPRPSSSASASSLQSLQRLKELC
uniref:leukocyte immunoglobulin-like receptor subfamily B member 1 isoform X1 n=1 Tax=Jaculus jaculus TaxID=51337 RepID=UPI001E1B453E|nr:leukocyte immunoglobulin-like receptor subfamily B member 1 isoform X1 [Jaculus jaculus]